MPPKTLKIPSEVEAELREKLEEHGRTLNEHKDKSVPKNPGVNRVIENTTPGPDLGAIWAKE